MNEQNLVSILWAPFVDSHVSIRRFHISSPWEGIWGIGQLGHLFWRKLRQL